MIRLLGKLPREINLAISGGPDSMCAYDFLRRNHKVHPVFFNHGSPDCAEAEKFLLDFFSKKGINLTIGRIDNPTKPNGKSLEEYWRDERYKFLSELEKQTNRRIVTAHHLDDQVETFLFSSLHGNPKLMKYFNGRVFRPFLLNTKDKLTQWCLKNLVPFIYDKSNSDICKRRNYIRKYIMPHALKVNPGLHTVILKKTISSYEEYRGEEGS